MLQTYEAIYESGILRFTDDVRQPEHTRVYVIVPEAVEKSDFRISSPRLVHPQQVADFVKEVVEEDSDASIGIGDYMDFEGFKARVQGTVPAGTLFQNPGGGTSEVLSISDKVVSYRRGASRIYVSLSDLFDAYLAYRGRRMSSTDLKHFRPTVFDSTARPAGHSCNCTFLFLLLRRLSIVDDIQGKGVRDNPYFVDVPPACG